MDPLDNLKPIPWKPGQSGNPSGYSKGRRAAAAIAKFMDEFAADPDLGRAVVAMATGRKKYLKDAEEDGGVRTPEVAWFLALRDTIDGKPVDKVEAEVTTDVNSRVVVLPAKRTEDPDPGSTGTSE